MPTNSNDLGPLPTVHPRAGQQYTAAHQLATLLANWQIEHRLTTAEAFLALTEYLHRQSKFAVSAERRQPCASLPTG